MVILIANCATSVGYLISSITSHEAVAYALGTHTIYTQGFRFVSWWLCMHLHFKTINQSMTSTEVGLLTDAKPIHPPLPHAHQRRSS